MPAIGYDRTDSDQTGLGDRSCNHVVRIGIRQALRDLERPAIGIQQILAQHDGPDLYEVFAGDETNPIDWDAFDPKSKKRSEIRKAVWRHTSEINPWLVAEPLGDESCKGALWARDSRLPPPVVLVETDEANEFTERKIAEFATSPEQAGNKADYQQFYAESA